MDATYLFARNFGNISYEDLSADIVEVTKSEILDTLGVAIAGFMQPGAQELRELVQQWGGTQESSIIGCSRKVPAPNAAQVNANMAHAWDYDDVHETAFVHPGVVAIPAALAAAELRGGLSGKELITVVALGVDTISRLGLATRPGVNPPETGWHFTTLYGYPTAALMVGRVLGLDEERMVNAFGIAYHQCGGNNQSIIDGALTKRMGPGFSVRGGLSAALMAAKGVTGARNCLEGEHGLYKMYHCGEYDRNILTRDLGRRFEGINVSIKPYPCCRGTHLSIEAALTMASKWDIDSENVKEIVLTTGAANYSLLCTPVEIKVRPRTPVDAQYSIPWGVAAAMANRRVTISDFTERGISNQTILGVAGKVKIEVDPALTRRRGIEPVKLKVAMNDGRIFLDGIDCALGSRERPLSFGDCARKFEDCTTLARDWGLEIDARKVTDLVGNLEGVRDLRQVISLFT